MAIKIGEISYCATCSAWVIHKSNNIYTYSQIHTFVLIQLQILHSFITFMLRHTYPHAHVWAPIINNNTHPNIYLLFVYHRNAFNTSTVQNIFFLRSFRCLFLFIVLVRHIEHTAHEYYLKRNEKANNNDNSRMYTTFTVLVFNLKCMCWCVFALKSSKKKTNIILTWVSCQVFSCFFFFLFLLFQLKYLFIFSGYFLWP